MIGTDPHLPAPVWFVTGCSTGLGRALSSRVLAAGDRVALTARDPSTLDDLVAGHPGAAIALPLDVTRPSEIEFAVAAATKTFGTIDVLVNNAGVVAQGEFTRSSAAAHQGMIDLNVAALTAMIAAVLPAMQRRGRGRILNVASIAAFQPVPSLATYAATKAYVLSLTESLAEELRDSGVSVTALCPGITATAMLEQATAHNGKLAALPGFLIGDVEAVAEAGYRACLAGEVIAVPGLLNRATALAAGATPRWLVRRVAGAFGRSVS